MENIIVSRPIEETEGFDAKKFPIMRTLAKFHECDAESLCSKVDASELDIYDVLSEMISRKEAESSPRTLPGGRRNEVFTLTLKGWGEYMKMLASIYELSE
jgi:hypothetical protein